MEIEHMMRTNAKLSTTYQFIKEYLETNPATNGPAMERQLCVSFPAWFGAGGDFPFNFGEAYALDEYFFRGGGRWRTAFSSPEDGALVTVGPQTFRAVNVGMFTFELQRL